MALVPKLASASSTVITSSPRPAAGARVAAVRPGPIEETALSTETFFDTSPYEYRGNQPQARNDGGHNSRQAQLKREHFGAINATSETFAALLDMESKSEVIDVFGNVHQKSSRHVVSQAISIYEQNSQVISGTNPVLGTEISLTL